MLRRCTPGSSHQRAYPAYAKCTVSAEWGTFEPFGRWFAENYVEGWHLDKDIIEPGNTVYGPEWCAFVPHDLNTMFKGRRDGRQTPMGVRARTTCFQAAFTAGRKRMFLGSFATEERAERAYLKAKRAHTLAEAERYAQDPRINPRVIEGMRQHAEAMTHNASCEAGVERSLDINPND